MEKVVILQRGSFGDSKAKRKRPDDPTAIATRSKKPRLASELSITSADDSKAIESLEAKFQVQVHSVISSSKIQKKVTSVLRHLTVSDSSADGLRVSVLRAKAPDAGKLVTIAEIAKRELSAEKEDETGGRWFQYIGLGEQTKEGSTEVGKKNPVEDTLLGDKGQDEDEDDDGGEAAEPQDDATVVTKTPLERAIEGPPKKQVVAVMNLFLSRISIDELKKRYGEQTNDRLVKENT
jgi:hypothetical protein